MNEKNVLYILYRWPAKNVMGTKLCSVCISVSNVEGRCCVYVSVSVCVCVHQGRSSLDGCDNLDQCVAQRKDELELMPFGTI